MLSNPVVLRADGEVMQAPAGWTLPADLEAWVNAFREGTQLQATHGLWKLYRLIDQSVLLVQDQEMMERWNRFLQEIFQYTSESEILDCTARFLQEGLRFTLMDSQIISPLYTETLDPSRTFSVALDEQRTQVWEMQGEHWSLLPELSEHISKALYRQHVFQRYLNALYYFQELQVSITDHLEWHETLKLVLYYTREALQADAAVFFLYDKGTETLELIDTIGHRTPTDYGYRIHRTYGLAGIVLKEMKTQVINHLDPDSFDLPSKEFLLREGFTGYVGTPLTVKGELLGILEVFHRGTLRPNAWWLSFFELLASHLAISVYQQALMRELRHTNQQLIRTYDATLEGWVRALDLRDKETEGHSKRVMESSMRLAKHMGIEGQDLEHIRRGALLHDIGKLGIPDEILHKPGKLTSHEFEIIKQHPVWAHAMLRDIEYLQKDLDIPYYHHEKWDGTGYPFGLEGEQIPLAARIFSVVDVWDAMTSDRPYRKGMPEEDVMKHIQNQSGRHFDPQVVQAFVEMMGKKP
ncbi:GAF and HD-GYP domain-containing protein [Deinococcus cellulosilyticus]|uniref:HD-GYP domain-containing protein n=1 Tax=Deinococcus cellulosilyticus (strain DSM 18568 / NBRC 106333 / KACC 11606 / 5516J-15) TaxID=1223518 RepID=A0A511MWG6_DEIC1|nr:HD domain-containing phosphohydrolase [Deinococcus cellulosilyticus]GEM44924.1 hypothetical protein DC3_05590 [Deinococcus cellulosilyticus NBRC 106333 = KACC 11606]